MKLAIVISDPNALPEALRPLVTQKDGKSVLEIDGVPVGYTSEAEVGNLKNQLAEFRDNNRALNTKVTDAEGKLKVFEGIDPEEHKALKAKAAGLEKKGVKDESDILKQIEAALAPVTKELKEIKEAEANAKRALATKDLEQALTTAGLKGGVDDKALTDFLSRGLRTWSIEEGKHVAKGPDGTVLRKSGEPITMEQWVADTAADAPHLFKGNKGAGAAPAGGGSGGSVRSIPMGTRLTVQDLADIKDGKAVRETAA